MIFGRTALEDAEGAILAHSTKAGATSFKKGRRLSSDDIAALHAAGVAEVVAARIEPGDVHEDAAAARIAAAAAGPGIKATPAFTGRSNLIAEQRGLICIDRVRLDAFNQVDEAVTLASLAPYALVEPRQMVATIKIIPFAIEAALLDQTLSILADGGPLTRVAPFRSRAVGLIQTELAGQKPALLKKGRAVIDARLAALGCSAARLRRCAHVDGAISKEIQALLAEGCELVLIAGASAIVDRQDVVPAGISRAGGQVEHFGMPVDPGNLLLLARVEDRPVLGLPGCARSPKLNGFDWVLQRLLADLRVTPSDIMAMGAGGLLKEFGGRPLPRAEAVEPATAALAPRIAAVILAAGRSTRMGAANKLLAEIDGKPMVRRVAEAVATSSATPAVLVTGHEASRVVGAVGPLGLIEAHNPDHGAGLSSSLHCGLTALPDNADGVIICLGDMPAVGPAVIDRLIAAFDPLEGRAICVPTWRGKRGNPVLLARRFIPEIQALSGDIGARAMIADYPELVAEVAMDDDAVLRDVDTPEALMAYLKPAR